MLLRGRASQRCWIAFISGACACRFCIEWIWRTVSGTSSIRTITVERDDRPRPGERRPVVVRGFGRGRPSGEARSIDAASRAMPASIMRVVDSAVAPRVAAQEAPAAAFAEPLQEAVPRAARRARTASSSGGTCRCPGGVSSPNVWRQAWTSADPERTSCRPPCPSTSVDALGEPVRARGCRPARPGPAARRGRSRGRGARLPESSAHVSRSSAYARLRTTALPAELGDGQAEPAARSSRPPRAGTSREPESAWRPSGRCDRRRRSPENATGGSGVARSEDEPGGAEAESRFRALALRRFRIACPARVDMRARKPCLRLRRRTLGWSVRFKKLSPERKNEAAGRRGAER